MVRHQHRQENPELQHVRSKVAKSQILTRRQQNRTMRTSDVSCERRPEHAHPSWWECHFECVRTLIQLLPLAICHLLADFSPLQLAYPSMATSIKLPLGSSHAIKLFGDEKLDYEFVKIASVRCLQSLPTNFSDDLFNDTELAAFAEQYGIPKPELTLVISMLKALWKQVVFHALKKDAFTSELARLNFTEAKIEALGTIWAEKGEETLKKLRNISHSGTPRLNGVNWFIGIERATSYTPAKRDLRALLRLDTSDGDKFQKLGYDELVKLHYQLQTVQDKMDSLIK